MYCSYFFCLVFLSSAHFFCCFSYLSCFVASSCPISFLFPEFSFSLHHLYSLLVIFFSSLICFALFPWLVPFFSFPFPFSPSSWYSSHIIFRRPSFNGFPLRLLSRFPSLSVLAFFPFLFLFLFAMGHVRLYIKGRIKVCHMCQVELFMISMCMYVMIFLIYEHFLSVFFLLSVFFYIYFALHACYVFPWSCSAMRLLPHCCSYRTTPVYK